MNDDFSDLKNIVEKLRFKFEFEQNFINCYRNTNKPISSVTCKHSFLLTRGVKNWLKNSMDYGTGEV